MGACVCINACAADSFTQTVVAFSSFASLSRSLCFISDDFIFHRNKLEIGSFWRTKNKQQQMRPAFLPPSQLCTCTTDEKEKNSIGNGGDFKSMSGIIIFIATRTHKSFPLNYFHLMCARAHAHALQPSMCLVRVHLNVNVLFVTIITKSTKSVTTATAAAAAAPVISHILLLLIIPFCLLTFAHPENCKMWHQRYG